MSNELGRGLSSLIPPKQNQFSTDAQRSASTEDVQMASHTDIIDIPIKEISPNPLQPRQHFNEQSLEELTESIKTYGLLEPIVVTRVDDEWQLVAGERRLRAFSKLQRITIPAIVRTTSELERLELSLIENIQREDLNPIEKSQALSRLVNEFGLTQVEAARKLGIARSTLANSIRLLDLPTEIQIGLAQGKITEGHAKVLLGVSNESEQLQLYRQMTSGPAMSVRALEIATGKKTPKKTKHALVDFEMRAIEDTLQASLGTKVSIKSKSSGTKQIIIDTFSEEEFKSVVRKIRKVNE